jgi:hypothetical protein
VKKNPYYRVVHEIVLDVLRKQENGNDAIIILADEAADRIIAALYESDDE